MSFADFDDTIRGKDKPQKPKPTPLTAFGFESPVESMLSFESAKPTSETYRPKKIGKPVRPSETLEKGAATEMDSFVREG